jgi:3-oxoacyl-[acyl-carrier protein] reductase
MSEPRTIIVTGAASGIGAATARVFAGADYRVAAVDRDGPGARAVAAELADGFAIEADHTDSAACEAVVAEVLARLGRIDALYNNAGIGQTGPIGEMVDATLDELLQVNIAGPYRMTRAALPALLAAAAERPTGAVLLFTASGLGLHGRANAAAYAATKHGIVGMMRSLALELGPSNIRVNALCPGFVDTPLIRAATGGWGTPDVVQATFAQSAPLKRLASAEDVARAALFLASDAATTLQGIALPVDGGEHIA